VINKELGTNVYLIRHGKPQYEFRDGKKLIYGPEALLSLEGERQAEEIAGRMPKLDAIYASSFERARRTAEIVADKHGITVVEVPELGDIVSPSAVGLPFDDVLQGKKIVTPTFEDETLEQLEGRTIPAFRKILEREKGRTFGIVGHGHGIRLIVLRFFEQFQGILPPISELEDYNYLNPGEAWFAAWDENGLLTRFEIIARPETTIVGKRHS